MSNLGLGRQQAREFAVGAAARRNLPVHAHEGTAGDFLCRLQQAAEAAHHDTSKRNEFFEKVFPWAVDARILHCAWTWGKSGNGQTPGSDGMHYGDIPENPPRLLWDLLRDLNQRIIENSYRPAPILEREIPKGSGKGTRTLEIPTILDRTVGRAIVQATQPYLEQTLDQNMFGGRPGKSRLHALAKAISLAKQGSRWVWVLQDVKNAFPSVPRGRLHDVLNHRLPNEKLTELEMLLLDNGKPKGIPQGQPLSPTAFNCYLDHFLCKPWRKKHPNWPLLAWLDDLLVLVRNKEEAESAHTDLENMLRIQGLKIKYPKDRSIVNLEDGAEWLGFKIRKYQDDFQVRIGDGNWENLERHLKEAHLYLLSPLRAIWVIEGWIEQLGPVFDQESSEEVVSRIVSLARTYSFEEIPSRKELVEKWEKAYSRWKAILEGACREKEGNDWGGSAMPICNSAGQSCGEAGLPTSPPLAGAQYNLYNDGACIVDTQLGGWAFVCDQLDREDVARHQSSGAASRTTNNRMELTAVVQGLESIPESARVEVVTDSLYVRKGMVNRLPAWKSQGWRAGSGRQLRSLCNADLWQRLDGLLQHRQVTVRWVPGHAGHPENELCDRLAREAAEQLARLPRDGQPQAASV
jgi:ribonuclease HI